MSPFKSKSQHRLFRALIARGKMKPETLEHWVKETGSLEKLPERVSKVIKRRRKKRR